MSAAMSQDDAPMEHPVLEVEDLHVAFRGRGGGTARAVDGVTSRSPGARSSRWWASRVAARRRWPGRSSDSNAPHRARCAITASRSNTRTRALKAYRRNVQLVLQDPTGVAQPPSHRL